MHSSSVFLNTTPTRNLMSRQSSEDAIGSLLSMAAARRSRAGIIHRHQHQDTSSTRLSLGSFVEDDSESEHTKKGSHRSLRDENSDTNTTTTTGLSHTSSEDETSSGSSSSSSSSLSASSEEEEPEDEDSQVVVVEEEEEEEIVASSSSEEILSDEDAPLLSENEEAEEDEDAEKARPALLQEEEQASTEDDTSMLQSSGSEQEELPVPSAAPSLELPSEDVDAWASMQAEVPDVSPRETSLPMSPIVGEGALKRRLREMRKAILFCDERINMLYPRYQNLPEARRLEVLEKMMRTELQSKSKLLTDLSLALQEEAAK